VIWVSSFDDEYLQRNVSPCKSVHNQIILLLSLRYNLQLLKSIFHSGIYIPNRFISPTIQMPEAIGSAVCDYEEEDVIF